jgi:hypothetical protein
MGETTTLGTGTTVSLGIDTGLKPRVECTIEVSLEGILIA